MSSQPRPAGRLVDPMATCIRVTRKATPAHAIRVGLGHRLSDFESVVDQTFRERYT